ncbi:MAG: membrane dipeptidase [Gemmatimonadetes bacterium]|nr:membrane dipeptidase [Gemmatimonadota bacterium]
MPAQRPVTAADSLVARAREIHKHVVTLDTHVDIPYQYATEFADPGRRDTFKVDYPKMKAGGLDAVFFIVYVAQGARQGEAAETAKELALTKFAAIRRATNTYKDRVALATKADDVAKIARAGKLAAMIGIENGYVIGKDLSLIAKYHALGARYMTLTHNGTNEIGDPSINLPGDTPNEWGGLSPFGRQVVDELNRVGIMVDISHNGKATMMQATQRSRAPVIASHSGVKALSDHPRNLDDEQLDAIKANDGVVQVVALGGFLKRPTPRDSSPATVKDLVDHIDYAVKRIGIDHVGISSDFDGGGGIVGWNDASETFNVTLELVKRGYSASDIEKIWGGNLIRVWKATEATAKKLQAARP